MIEVACEQGSEQWRDERRGVITASNADRILTPSKLNLSSQAIPYIHNLIAEARIGQTVESPVESEWMRRGKELEPRARAWYARFTGQAVREIGFVTTDDSLVGCSPDGLVGDDGGLEIKVPHAGTMIGYALDPDSFKANYRGQVQMSLWITRRKWWDLLAWNPSRQIPNVLLRCLPDPAYQAALDKVLPDLCKRLVEGIDRIRNAGPVVGVGLDL